MIVQIRDWRRRADGRAMAAWGDHPEPIATRWNMHKSEPGQRRDLAIVTEPDTIGRISLYGMTDSAAWLGIWLAPGKCSQGIGTEAMRQAVALAFGELRLKVLCLAVAQANQRATRCYTRLGFVTVGQEWRSAGDLAELYQLMRLERGNHGASGRVGYVGARPGAAPR